MLCPGSFGVVNSILDPVLPEPPTNFTHISSPSSITIFWDPPEQSLKFIEGYIVGYGQFLPEVYRETVSNQETAFTIMGLGNVFFKFINIYI